jgi:hypothetical protein
MFRCIYYVLLSSIEWGLLEGGEREGGGGRGGGMRDTHDERRRVTMKSVPLARLR